MTQSPRWLIELLKEARASNWCAKIGCTTCGASEFQRALAERLCRQAGIAIPPRLGSLRQLDPASFRSILELASADISQSIEAEVMGTSGDRWFFDLGMIFHELRLLAPLYPDRNVTKVLENAWAWTAAMAKLKEGSDRRRARLLAEEERQAAERKRNGIRREAREARHQANRMKREEVLTVFQSMSPAERLAALADNHFGLPLEAFPCDSIPMDREVLACIPFHSRQQLIARIGEISGYWKQMKRLIESIQ